MKRLRLFAGLAAFCLALISLSISAQATLGAPTDLSITGSTAHLTISWSAPLENGGSTITAYDLRYIRNDATNKSEDQWSLEASAWSSGSLTYTLTGLARDIAYDVQLRAVNANDDGPWSAIATASTTDHSDTTSGATTLALGSSIEGSINPADDADYFRIVVPSQDDLWVYASGGLDTVGQLFNARGELLVRNEDGLHIDFPRAFSIRFLVDPGTYYLKVESREGKFTGTYKIHANTAAEARNVTGGSATIALDSMAPGRLYFPGGPFGAKDEFKFVLTEETEIWAVAIGLFDSLAALLDADSSPIAQFDDSEWLYNPKTFMIRRTLSAGTYFILIGARGVYDAGPYTLELRTVSEPGSSQSNAAPLTLDVAQTGNLSSATDIDYFTLTLDEDTYVLFSVTSFAGDLPVSIAGIDAMTERYSIPHTAWVAQNRGKVGFWTWGKLAAGTYNLQVSAASGGSGSYLLHVEKSRYGEVLRTCEGLMTAQSDPWYGCQWHLKNTGQFPGGAMQDINVEPVWSGGNMGSGIKVVVVDDGMHTGHEDLTDNIDSTLNYNYTDDTDPNDRVIFDQLETHGTSVAGIIAARDNSLGVRGVAPRATIYGYNLLAGGSMTSANEADAMTRNMAETAVSNNSWGFPDRGDPRHAPAAWQEAVVKGVTEGFGGKGVLYVWAAGNGHQFGDHSNLDGRANHYAVTAVCAVNYDDKRSSYSEIGANLWVCGPSDDYAAHPELPSITTTDNGDRYLDRFGGTFAAAPVVSGVAALVRAANNDLTWRDVKLILAASARKNDSSDTGWQRGAEKYNATGNYWFNHAYGFGTVDAKAAVDLASGWSLVPPMREITAERTGRLRIPDTASTGSPGRRLNVPLVVGSFVESIEFVEVEVHIVNRDFRELRVELISPSGTVSVLSTPGSPERTSRWEGVFRFGSARHLGEPAAGTWRLRVRDYRSGGSGVLRGWKLKIYGHGVRPNKSEITSLSAADSSIKVDWDEPADRGETAITSYDLRYIRSDASDTNWMSRTAIATTDAASYELTGLEPGVYYDIQIRARNSGGVGVWSETEEGNTSPVTPLKPSIAGVTGRAAELTVRWTPPTQGQVGISSYDVRYIRSDATDKTTDTNWTTEQGAWTTGDHEFEYAVTGLENGVSYDVQVRAVNGEGNGEWSSTTSGRPMVANPDPAFPSETATRSVRENTAAGRNIGPPVRATDSNGDTLTYTLAGTDRESFDINARSGQLQTMAPLNFEGTTSYSVTVEVSDGKDANAEADTVIDDTIDVTIMVTGVNEAPEVTGETDLEVDENSALFLSSYDASDPEQSTVTWDLGGPDRLDFTITADGELSFAETPDYDRPADANGDNRYELFVEAGDGSMTGSLGVTVTVDNMEEPPQIVGPTDIDYPENAARAVATYKATDPEGKTVIWSLTGSDRDRFTLADNRLTFKSPPSYEDRPAYMVTVRASDARLHTDLPVRVDIENLDEDGVLTFSPAQPVANIRFGAVHTDQDGLVSETWSWHRSPDRGTWTAISGAATNSYIPETGDIGSYLRATVVYEDGHGSDKTRLLVSKRPVAETPGANEPPEFATASLARAIAENSFSGTPVGDPVTATDPNDDPLAYELAGIDADKFTIDSSTGQIRVGPGTLLDREFRGSYLVSVIARDTSRASRTAAVSITVTDVNEPPSAADHIVTVREDMPTSINLVSNASDPEEDPLTVTIQTHPRSGNLTVEARDTMLYSPHANFHGEDSFRYRVSDGQFGDEGTVIVVVQSLNDAPGFPAGPLERTVFSGATEGENVGQPVTATDVDGDRLHYRLLGGPSFEIDESSGQIVVGPNAAFDPAVQATHTVTVIADDRQGGTASTEVTITPRPAPPPIIFIPGPGAPSGPTTSDEDFEWTVERDIEQLDPGNNWPTGLWSDGATLWIAENGEGADDEVYAYDRESGERLGEQEFALDETNRAPRGFWSDGATLWVSDSGRDRLFAYHLESGERDETREFELSGRNRDARGIWSDGETVWVLDGRTGSLFAYDLASGELLGEYELAPANSDPRGIWSDRFSVWVSDHGAKHLFAYQLPTLPEGPADEDTRAIALTRVRDEEFPNTVLSRASNNSPRGIWSDGDVMYVADESDDKVYSYNMPDAIDARLASLTLSGIDIGEFAPGRTGYEAVAGGGVTETTIEAEAAQPGATLVIDPADADEAAAGHQAAVAGGADVAVTVTSPDGSRTRVYRVHIRAPGPSANCLRGAVGVGFSLAVSEGGSLDDLLACGQSRGVTALYTLDGGEYVSYILGAPDFVNARFRALFAGGVPALTPLTARSEEPVGAAVPAPAPAAAGDTQPWPVCLRGEIGEGFSLAVYEGGSVDELAACAARLGVAALYALAEGEYVPYILGAPDFVNARFAALFPDAVPSVTPLVTSAGPPTASSDGTEETN